MFFLVKVVIGIVCGSVGKKCINLEVGCVEKGTKVSVSVSGRKRFPS